MHGTWGGGSIEVSARWAAHSSARAGSVIPPIPRRPHPRPHTHVLVVMGLGVPSQEASRARSPQPVVPAHRHGRPRRRPHRYGGAVGEGRHTAGPSPAAALADRSAFRRRGRGRLHPQRADDQPSSRPDPRARSVGGGEFGFALLHSERLCADAFRPPDRHRAGLLAAACRQDPAESRPDLVCGHGRARLCRSGRRHARFRMAGEPLQPLPGEHLGAQSAFRLRGQSGFLVAGRRDVLLSPLPPPPAAGRTAVTPWAVDRRRHGCGHCLDVPGALRIRPQPRRPVVPRILVLVHVADRATAGIRPRHAAGPYLLVGNADSAYSRSPGRPGCHQHDRGEQYVPAAQLPVRGLDRGPARHAGVRDRGAGPARQGLAAARTRPGVPR